MGSIKISPIKFRVVHNKPKHDNPEPARSTQKKLYTKNIVPNLVRLQFSHPGPIFTKKKPSRLGPGQADPTHPFTSLTYTILGDL